MILINPDNHHIVYFWTSSDSLLRFAAHSFLFLYKKSFDQRFINYCKFNDQNSYKYMMKI
jgi:hypothetical protein